MKSLKMKLFTGISMFVIALSILIIGVWAIGEAQTITMNGNVTFNIADDSLYIKDVKIKQDNNNEPTSVSSFMPGYINGNFDMDLTNLDTNTLGSFNLYFYIINTSSNIYNATLSLTGDIVQQNVSVALENTQIPATALTDGEAITQDTSESVILILQVSTTNEILIDFSDITINIDQIQYVNITTLSSNTNLGSVMNNTVENQIIVGEELTISAKFTGDTDADFLGWRADSITGELVSTLPEYTFTYKNGMTTSYFAIFEEYNEADNPLIYELDELNNEATVKGNDPSIINIVIPSEIRRDGVDYFVTKIGLKAFYEYIDLESVLIPNSIKEISAWSFFSCSSLLAVTIPENVNYIGNYSFANTYNLTEINFFATTMDNQGEDGYIFRYAGRDGDGIILNIGFNVINIPNWILDGSSSNVNILEIIIADGSLLQSIGDEAFSGCSKLEVFKIGTQTPPTIRNNGTFPSHTFQIQVPSASVNAYKSASGWSSYASQIVGY